jgi:hypothetical protein
MIKLYPVGGMKVRHIASTILLMQITPISYTLSTSLLLTQSTKRRTDGDGRTYTGFTKTRGGNGEHPGNEANSTRIG